MSSVTQKGTDTTSSTPPLTAAVAAARGTAARQLTRPVVIALVTFLVSVGVFGLQIGVVRRAVRSLIDPVVELGRTFPFSVLAALLGGWLFVFGLCAVYLIHLHGFSGRYQGLLDPLVSVWLAWTVAAVEIAGYRPGDLSAGTFTALTVASATAATSISAWQLVALRRKGITFRRGPWAA